MIARLLERPLVRVQDAFEALDAIVVLGAPLGPGGALTDVLRERVDAAARLYHAGGGPIVIASGGVTGSVGRASVPARAEADAIAEALAAHGIVAIGERASRTTAENAANSAAILRARGATSAWIVTHPFHTRRAVYLFAREGIDARAVRITDRRKLRWALREYAAWAKLAVTRARRRT